MRTTQMMLANNTLRHISSNYQRMGQIQDQLSTGKKITRASQDPVVAMNGMRYRTQVAEMEQFKRNLSETYNWMETTDATLDKVTQTLHRVRELTVQAANDSYTADQRENIRKEVSQLRDHLVGLANTKINNKFIFNGTDTINPPVNEAAIRAAQEQALAEGEVPSLENAVSTNDQNVNIELLKGVYVPVNINPTTVFTDKLFSDLIKIEQALSNPTTSSADISALIDVVAGHIDNVVNERAEQGARFNRIEMIENRVWEQEIIAKRIMSNNEDADFEKVIIDLTTQESVHRAALAAGARIIQPTLMDFLR
ncbi:flagellar hook-associated protein FlgL [Anaerobacillus alkaliphilus]|uniref:Flagellar hook-associated protein FlgL n=1 Tax=Anaerobacillus alkaliphilus TaxID=1548597 RepID=A0A4Q0VXB8_9BACI|nr:flagellar hook-associated protein FlgL [Anaerobacillus alkaliphilus]RXJ02285.1 flagellar hook-associated protein FlgL [Anaerobacillus alkaliphilus]